MYEPKPADPGDKPFECVEDPKGDLPGPKQPFRELLDALSERVKALAPANEASTKFPDELKDIEKEYQGIDAIVAKYKEFYDKQLDCKLADVRRWRAKINEWSSTLDQNARDCIAFYHKSKYVDREQTICCRWINLRRALIAASDPLTKAKNNEALKQEAYDKLKGFLDTVTKIFTDLEGLFKQADAFNKDNKPKSVFAVSLEFEELYKLLDWPKTDEERCPPPVPTPNGGTGEQPQPSGEYAQQPTGTPPPGGYAATPPPPSSEGGYQQSQESPAEGSSEGSKGDSDLVKKKLSPTELRARLICALRALVRAKFQRLLIHHKLLNDTADAEAAKKECEKFRADRQKLFLEVAEDIPTGPDCDKGQGGGGGGGQPSGGGYGQQPPGGGGYGQRPPGGGGGYGQQQPPPTGGYQQQPPGGGQEPPPSGGYQQQPPSGGQQPPSGGYEPQTPSGGYEKPPRGGYPKK